MRLAIATRNGRVSPVFDVARQVLVVEVSGRDVTGRREAQLEENAERKVEQLAAEGIDVLVCGALSQVLARRFRMQGVRVVPFVAGAVEEVLRAFMSNRLNSARFAMPGCCGRGPGRRAGWGGRCRGRGWRGGRVPGSHAR